MKKIRVTKLAIIVLAVLLGCRKRESLDWSAIDETLVRPITLPAFTWNEGSNKFVVGPLQSDYEILIPVLINGLLGEEKLSLDLPKSVVCFWILTEFVEFEIDPIPFSICPKGVEKSRFDQDYLSLRPARESVHKMLKEYWVANECRAYWDKSVARVRFAPHRP